MRLQTVVAIVKGRSLYGQWNRYGFCPGLDVRVQGNTGDVHGYLVGPRVAYQPRGRMNPFRLYAEGLFGKNEVPDYAAITSLTPSRVAHWPDAGCGGGSRSPLGLAVQLARY